MKKGKINEINKKFVLVGDGYCGKSTLIAAFYNRKFVDNYTPTIFDTFTVTTDIYKKHVNLEICDSAGQKEFSRVRPLSYPEVDAIILCFSIDSRESSQNILELWLPEIRHFCTNKVPIVLVGCKIDLRLDRTTTSLNRHFMLKQEHLNRINSFSSTHQTNNNNTISSLHYGLFKTLTSYCCRHERMCTCYHSRVCSTRCMNTSSFKHKSSNLSNSSNCLLNTSSNDEQTAKNNIIHCNRMRLHAKSPTRNSTNTEPDSLSNSDVDGEEVHSNTMSNTMSSSSCSLNATNHKSNFTQHSAYDNTYNNSIYRHNQSMLNTLIHQQIEQKQCANSLNSSESDESEVIDGQEEQQINQIGALDLHLPVTEHLQSSIENQPHTTTTRSAVSAKSQPNLMKALKFPHRSRLFKGYKSFINSSTETETQSRSLKLNKMNMELSKKSCTSLKDRKIFKTSSLKQKLSTLLGVNSNSSTMASSSIYPSKSEKKLTNLFYNRKLSTSSASLTFPSIYKANSSVVDHHSIDDDDSSINGGSFITTEEGLRLCAKIGAQAYVECSSKMNIGVDDVFRTGAHTRKLDKQIVIKSISGHLKVCWKLMLLFSSHH
ncbi:Ras-like GTP-binding protein RHO [Pseudolycoriella hygida]|uniref:Ras-like GTP-binding protein RHO n=1 Tax=Pseudolycoriella hygida TaxID=35572 RepID=A0A9Q0N3W4_9DIPT|nr:Ras-like GTP-binding protein RHO [Pseudolycoriella hygida]